MAHEFRITCPHCAARFRLKGRQHLGKVKPCPKCHEEFELRDTDESLMMAETVIRQTNEPSSHEQAEVSAKHETSSPAVPASQITSSSQTAPRGSEAASAKRRPLRIVAVVVCMAIVIGTGYGFGLFDDMKVNDTQANDVVRSVSGDTIDNVDDAGKVDNTAPSARSMIAIDEPSGTITAFRPTESTTFEVSAASNSSSEWTQFRGPNRLNISPETGLLNSWPSGGPRLVRVIEGLGAGYSSVSISNGVIYTLGSDADSEYLLAFDAEFGEQLWSTRLGRLRKDGTGDGPRSTPTVDGDHVYGLSAHGDLVCANRSDGSVAWRLNILEEFNARNIGWGISESPLIDGDRLICTPGGRDATMVALDKRTGSVVWTVLHKSQTPAGYASPIRCRLAGVDQYVTFAHHNVFGVDLDGKNVLWSHSEAANGTANCSTPVPWQDSVFYASAYGTGGALVDVSESGSVQQASTNFFTRKMENHHGGMVVVDDHVYGTDGGALTCIDLRTGDIAWQKRSVGKGSVIAADGHLYLRSEQGPVALVELNASEYVEKSRFDQQHRSEKPAWSHPVICGKRLYLRDWDKLLIYDLAE